MKSIASVSTHAVLLALFASIMFAGCDNTKRNVSISGRLSAGAARAKGGYPVILAKEEAVEIAIRLEGAGVWEKPNTMSCSVSAGQFEKIVHAKGAQDDPVNANYVASLTQEGKLVATDKRCGEMSATKIGSIDKVELRARISTNRERCHSYCSVKAGNKLPTSKCLQKCEASPFLVATPIVSSGAIEKLLSHAKEATSGDTTVGTGLELVFDSLSDSKQK